MARFGIRGLCSSISAAAVLCSVVLAIPAAAQSSAGSAAPWTGFNLNVGLGHGVWSAGTTTILPSTGVCRLCTEQEQGGDGIIGRGGVGFDYQVDRWVWGVFGDVDFGDIAGTIQDQDPYFASRLPQTHSFAVGGRAGWLVLPDLLPYVSAGYTQAYYGATNMVTTFVGAATPFSTPGFTTGGWFIGGGAEYRLTPDWSVRGEYRHAEYDGKDIVDTCTGCGGPQSTIRFHPSTDTFVASVVYKFNPLSLP